MENHKTTDRDDYRIAVYQYGLGAPLDWAHDCEQQLIAETRLWNTLVEIDRSARAGYYRALAQVHPELARLEERRDELLRKKDELWIDIKAKRAQRRSKNVDDAAEREAIAACRQELAALTPQLQTMRRDARALAKPLLDANEAQRRESAKAARQPEASGLWWGNYNAVMASYETARARAMRDGVLLRPHVYNGNGSLTCQLMGGMSPGELFAGEREIAHIDPPPSHLRARGPGNPRQCYTLVLTAYTDRDETGRRRRRTVRFPLFLDRPLPDAARVQSITAVRRRFDRDYRWRASFLVREPMPPEAPQAASACAVHFAWRRTAAGLRVAVVAGDDGHVEHIAISERWLHRREHCDVLQSQLDENLNDIAAWLRSDWREDAPEALARLRPRGPKPIPAQYAALAIVWRDHSGYRPEARERLERWRKGDKLAREQMVNLRDKLQAARREQYRIAAKRLRMRYGTIYVDALDGAKAARLITPEGEETPLHLEARHQRVLAAIHVLRDSLRESIKVSPQHTTDVCASCGARGTVPPDDIVWRCQKCDALHDRDENAAKNLLAAGRASAAATQADDTTARARESERKATRYVRFAEAKAQAKQRAALLQQERSQNGQENGA